jgi:hypothetical protein
VGDRNLVHADVIVVTEIQKFFSSELSDVDGNDRVRDLKTKNDVLDRIHCLLRADFSQELRLDPHSEFIDHDEQVS